MANNIGHALPAIAGRRPPTATATATAKGPSYAAVAATVALLPSHPIHLATIILSTIFNTMTDEVFPDSVKDFVFDLHDATRRSFIHSEQQNLYNQFRGEITAKVSEGRQTNSTNT